MTGFRKHLAQGLVATIVLCALGFMVCGSMAAPGNSWERVCFVLMCLMLGSMIGALALVAATYAEFRLELATQARRPALSDEQFAAMLSDPSAVDLELVGRIRALAAHYFRSIGGERFYPGDRLQQDLHLLDLVPFGCENFLAVLEESLGLREDELRARLATREVVTLGDLIVVAAFLAERRREGIDMESRT
jgi:hypothetical protein